MSEDEAQAFITELEKLLNQHRVRLLPTSDETIETYNTGEQSIICDWSYEPMTRTINFSVEQSPEGKLPE